MDEENKKETQKMIDEAVTKHARFNNRKIGDTPTDDRQLVPKGYVVSSIAGRVFGGRVDVDGNAISLPEGWTSSKPAEGTLQVTHNLGHTGYGVSVIYMRDGDPATGVDYTTYVIKSSVLANTFRTRSFLPGIGAVNFDMAFTLAVNSSVT